MEGVYVFYTPYIYAYMCVCVPTDCQAFVVVVNYGFHEKWKTNWHLLADVFVCFEYRRFSVLKPKSYCIQEFCIKFAQY